MGFAFSPEQRERLFEALGRSDSGAWHLTEDVELALEAYSIAELANDADPGDCALEFGQTLAQATRLRVDLNALPDRARQLAALEVISSDAAVDLIRLGNSAGEALERLCVRLAAISVPLHPHTHPCAMAERFVHAVGQAFRNRLNIKPTTDAHGLFRRFLDVLIDLVRRRHADLDELSGVMTDERLKQILAFD